MRKNKYIVYAVIDPRDGQTFYIGKSCSGTDTMKRHHRPSSLRDKNPRKNSKIQEILDVGMIPTYEILQICKNKRELALTETVLIRYFSKKFNLLNMVNNRAPKEELNQDVQLDDDSTVL